MVLPRIKSVIITGVNSAAYLPQSWLLLGVNEREVFIKANYIQMCYSETSMVGWISDARLRLINTIPYLI